MNPMALINNAVGNGSLDPNQILKMFTGKSKIDPFDFMLSTIVNTLYEYVPENEYKNLFIEDPRNSEKRKAVVTLIEKAAPKFVENMSEKDVDILFNKIQMKKEK
jgi:hypothetical protein